MTMRLNFFVFGQKILAWLALCSRNDFVQITVQKNLVVQWAIMSVECKSRETHGSVFCAYVVEPKWCRNNRFCGVQHQHCEARSLSRPLTPRDFRTGSDVSSKDPLSLRRK